MVFPPHSLRDITGRKLHHSNGMFVNPFDDGDRHGIRRMGQIFYWKVLTKNRYKHLYAEESVQPVTVDWHVLENNNRLSITWLKHACLLINDRGHYLLVDPVFGGLLGLFKDFTPFDFEISLLPKPHHVLITHGHYDHLDKNTLQKLDKDTHIISPVGYDKIFDELNLRNHLELDWFENYRTDGCRITLLPCNHWTMRNPILGPNRALWGSYLIETRSGHTIYIAGDTAYFEGFSEIGDMFKIDLAIFNLGAYEPRWFMKTSHMNPEETLRAARLLRAKKFAIVHWGTFRLGDEPVFLPPVDLMQLLKKSEINDRFINIRHGQTIDETDLE